MMQEGIARVRALRWTPTSGGFFAFGRVEGCADSDALARTLLEEAHVITIPGAAFGAAGEGHLRLSYGYASLDDLREALDRLSRFFDRS
jgi:aminotransferase